MASAVPSSGTGTSASSHFHYFIHPVNAVSILFVLLRQLFIMVNHQKLFVKNQPTSNDKRSTPKDFSFFARETSAFRSLSIVPLAPPWYSHTYNTCTYYKSISTSERLDYCSIFGSQQPSAMDPRHAKAKRPRSSTPSSKGGGVFDDSSGLLCSAMCVPPPANSLVPAGAVCCRLDDDSAWLACFFFFSTRTYVRTHARTHAHSPAIPNSFISNYFLGEATAEARKKRKKSRKSKNDAPATETTQEKHRHHHHKE